MEEGTQKKKGVNLNTALNIILIIGLAVLYVLYFTDKKSGENGPAKITGKTTENIPTIAFVDSDSLMANYEMFKEMQTKLQAKQKKLEGQLQWQRSQFEKEAQTFYEKIQSGGFKYVQII